MKEIRWLGLFDYELVLESMLCSTIKNIKKTGKRQERTGVCFLIGDSFLQPELSRSLHSLFRFSSATSESHQE
jgi:hypothetical protein